jgi:hypothetical protein
MAESVDEVVIRILHILSELKSMAQVREVLDALEPSGPLTVQELDIQTYLFNKGMEIGENDGRLP